jgi:hypothetical protein
MGSCLSACGGKAAEAKKTTAFQTIDTDHRNSEGATVQDDRSHVTLRDSDDGVNTGSSSLLDGASSNNNGNTATSQMDAMDAERLKSLREEQARLDLLVATTGRDMVAVRSTRGSTGYYDQGFAAALAQHLEQTTEFPNQLPQRLPPPPQDLQHATNLSQNSNTSVTNNGSTTNNSTVSSSSTTAAAASGTTSTTSSSASALYAILSQPMWEGIVLGPSREGLAGCGGENPSRYMDRVAESILDATVPTKEEMFAGLGPMVENLL